MARSRKRIAKDEPVGRMKKLFPGDTVPKTGHYKLDEGIHIKPVRESKSKTRTPKQGRLKKVKRIGRGRGR